MFAKIWHALFENAKPIDETMLVIETLVLALIFYDVVIGIRERRKKKRQSSSQSEKVKRLTGLIEEGQQIRNIAPSPHTNTDYPTAQAQWLDTANKWTNEVNELLMSYSSRASARFMHVINSRQGDNMLGLIGGT